MLSPGTETERSTNSKGPFRSNVCFHEGAYTVHMYMEGFKELWRVGTTGDFVCAYCTQMFLFCVGL